MAEKRNSAIVCCRTVSMLMIVLCHIIGRYKFIPGHGVLGDLLDAGVYSFLVISGYLYGGKNIHHFGHWFWKRYTTIALPAFVVVVSVLIAEFCIGENHDVFSIIVYFLNLQGLGFLIPDFLRYFSKIQVLGPLWFVTVIMLCYCMVPALQRYRQKLCAWKHCKLITLGAAVTSYIFALATGINTVYFLTFAIGYFLSCRNHEFFANKSDSIYLSVLMIVAQALRLVLHYVCDGTSVYQTYALYSHMVLGIWILWLFLEMNHRFPKLIGCLAEKRWMIVANDISLYVYLTHYCFCRGRLDMYQLTDNLLLATAGFVAATLLSAIVLKEIVKFIQRCLSAYLQAPI